MDFPDSENSIKVENLTYFYGARPALNGVNFNCAAGRFCALLGLNGAGKSTLIGILTRLQVPDEGRITIAGHDLATEPRAALAKLGIVFQQTTLDLDLSVLQNMAYFAALHGLSGPEARRRIDAVLEMLAVGDRADEIVRNLNGGHRRRVEIARALIHQPSILILDEPTVGLDAATRFRITDHMHDLAKEAGITVIWTTHLVDEIRPDDDVIILHKGRVLAHDRAEILAADGSLANAFLAMTGEDS